MLHPRQYRAYHVFDIMMSEFKGIKALILCPGFMDVIRMSWWYRIMHDRKSNLFCVKEYTQLHSCLFYPQRSKNLVVEQWKSKVRDVTDCFRFESETFVCIRPNETVLVSSNQSNHKLPIWERNCPNLKHRDKPKQSLLHLHVNSCHNKI